MSFEFILLISIFLFILSISVAGFIYLLLVVNQLKKQISNSFNSKQEILETTTIPKPLLSSSDLIQDKLKNEFEAKISQLEEQLALYKRQGTGVVLTWLATKEDSMAYVLEIYNDTPDKIFNIQVHIDPTYQQCANIFGIFDKCDPQKSIEISFVPGGWITNPKNAENINRNNFLELWLQEKLKPIKFTVMYTITPRKQDFKILEVDFKKEQAARHMKTRLQQLKSKVSLTLLPSEESEELS
jgi:hypothetical protein